MKPIDCIKPFYRKVKPLRINNQETAQSQSWQDVLNQVEKQHFQGNRFDSRARQGFCTRSPRVVEALRKSGIEAAVYENDGQFRALKSSIEFPHAFVVMREPRTKELLIVDLSISQLTRFTNIPRELNGFFYKLCTNGFVPMGKNKENLYKYLQLIKGCSEQEIADYREKRQSMNFVLDKSPWPADDFVGVDDVLYGSLSYH